MHRSINFGFVSSARTDPQYNLSSPFPFFWPSPSFWNAGKIRWKNHPSFACLIRDMDQDRPVQISNINIGIGLLLKFLLLKCRVRESRERDTRLFSWKKRNSKSIYKAFQTPRKGNSRYRRRARLSAVTRLGLRETGTSDTRHLFRYKKYNKWGSNDTFSHALLLN